MNTVLFCVNKYQVFVFYLVYWFLSTGLNSLFFYFFLVKWVGFLCENIRENELCVCFLSLSPKLIHRNLTGVTCDLR